MITADGFELAFLGVGAGTNSVDIAVYDYDVCAEVLMTRDKMSVHEAYEYLDFNVVGAYVGVGTPLFIRTITYEEAIEEYS
mgnify:CR=1 FL=1|tara:strand:- start:291 stop:533 length:243 start_codon:yes stop_codon:yes gene_type:complete